MELPDYRKIEFPDMPPIPLVEVVPEVSPEVLAYYACVSYETVFV